MESNPSLIGLGLKERALTYPWIEYLLKPINENELLSLIGLIYRTLLRLRRICSRDDCFDEQLDEYYQFFKRRKYKDSVIRKGFDQARNTPSSNALLRKSRANDTRRNLVLVMDYHPNLKDLPKLIKSHLPTLYESPRMRKLFSNDKSPN